MDIFPILATLKRHKTAAGLIVLQVALTCAIVCNALFLISQRLERINEPSGLAESELVVVGVSGLSRSQDPDATTRADLQALRALPGVKSAALMNQIPMPSDSTIKGNVKSSRSGFSTVLNRLRMITTTARVVLVS